ncbi:MAG TPA: protein kinase [Longimicrobiales bacterium]
MMDTTRWQTLQDLFARALAVPADERCAFLSDVCADDGLRQEVQALLDAADRDGPLDALAQRLVPVRDLFSERVPDRVGPYIMKERIGAGGMAVVYRAHDPRLQRDVALKFLPASLHDASPAADRLIGEARAASALDHPNICTIFDIASAGNDRLFIAMAYYSGGTLEDRLRDGPLPVVESIGIARQVADALQCAHEAGIVHRDVKPANIAFGERGEVKVLDFGVAVLTDDAAGGGTAGTPSYMAPEQVRGEPTDPRSDVWALGVVLFEMLTGRRPFGGADRSAVHDEILHANPPAVTSLRGDVPQRLAAIVDRALDRDPSRRFQTAAELAAALDTARLALPRVHARRRRVYAAAAAIVLLFTTGAIARLQRSPAAGDSVRAAVADQYLRARERYFRGTPESNEAAIVILNNLVQRDSMHAPSRALLAAAYAVATRADFSRPGRTEWLDSAFVHAHAAIALAPALPDGYSALGSVLRWSGRLEEAKEQFERALAVDPRHGLSMLELGLVSHLLSLHADAVLWLERGLAIEPDVPAGRQYASALYRAFDMPEEARRHIATGRLIAPDDASLIWESALVELDQGDTVAARADFEAYLQLITAGERERMQAWFAYIIGDLEKARAHLERLDLSAAPSYDLTAFGMAYLAMGEDSIAEPLLRRALAAIDREAGAPEWGRTNPGFSRGRVLAALGEREAAIAALQDWADNGGLRTWRRLDREPVWSSIVNDPRFQDVMRRSEERFRERQQHVMAELSRLRD